MPPNCRASFKHKKVTLAGLGARDTLRLEAGLPLWGHELDETITPTTAGLTFALSKKRREAANFPGASIILDELAGVQAGILLASWLTEHARFVMVYCLNRTARTLVSSHLVDFRQASIGPPPLDLLMGHMQKPAPN